MTYPEGTMTTKYPEGTRWAVKWIKGNALSSADVWEREQSDCWTAGAATDVPRTTHGNHDLAKQRLDMARAANPRYRDAIVLVRIPPPRPKRSVEERIKAVRADALNSVLRWTYGEGRGVTMPLAVLAELETLLASQGAYNIRPTLKQRDLATLVHGTTKAAVDAAVRERTEVILTEWQAPLSESKRRPIEQPFADWLRDLLDGKVST